MLKSLIAVTSTFFLTIFNISCDNYSSRNSDDKNLFSELKNQTLKSGLYENLVVRQMRKLSQDYNCQFAGPNQYSGAKLNCSFESQKCPKEIYDAELNHRDQEFLYCMDQLSASYVYTYFGGYLQLTFFKVQCFDAQGRDCPGNRDRAISIFIEPDTPEPAFVQNYRNVQPGLIGEVSVLNEQFSLLDKMLEMSAQKSLLAKP